MKKILKKILSVVVLGTAVLSASAQKTGFTFSFLNAAFYANASPMTQGYMGLGLERNVGDYISLKLELNNGFQVFYKVTKGKILGTLGTGGYERSFYDSSSGYSSYFNYHWTVPSFDINYQSKFFFRGNDRTGAYLAMGIGIRSVKYVFHIGSPDGYDNNEAPDEIQRKDEYSESFIIVPLMLRIGARGDMDGFFPDFSFGLGYNLSHDKTVSDNTLINKWDLTVPKLTGLAVTASISFGIGW